MYVLEQGQLIAFIFFKAVYLFKVSGILRRSQEGVILDNCYTAWTFTALQRAFLAYSISINKYLVYKKVLSFE